MNTVLRMLSTLTAIGILSGGFLSQVSDWAAPQIEKHMQEAIRRAVSTVHPGGARSEKVAADSLELYKVFDAEDLLVGYAMNVTGNGFSDKITLMVGVSEDLESISGIEILKQTDTPGLGAKIVEPEFKDKFKNLLTAPQVAVTKKENPAPNEIQAITAATITSKAVVDIVNTHMDILRKLKTETGL
ncbi:MAG: FMN-binding protein [Acidobacteria bacterium]|nr:FMN-binding protein [Acidobacteriota bacterium]